MSGDPYNEMIRALKEGDMAKYEKLKKALGLSLPEPVEEKGHTLDAMKYGFEGISSTKFVDDPGVARWGPGTVHAGAYINGQHFTFKGAAFTTVQSQAHSFNLTHPLDMHALLRMRLRLGEHEDYKGIEHVHIYSAADKVCVFYYKDGMPNVLEEEASIFPSDSMVAQFRLIMG